MRIILTLLLLLIPVAGAAEERSGIHVRVVPGLSFDAPERVEVPAVEPPDQVRPEPESSGPDVLYFGASWCGPCKSQKPVIAALKAQGYDVQEIDVDTQHDLQRKHNITDIPAWVVPGGKRLVGAQTEASVKRILGAAEAVEGTTPFSGLVRVRVQNGETQGWLSGVCIGPGGDGWLFLSAGHAFTKPFSKVEVDVRGEWLPARVLHYECEDHQADIALLTAETEHDLRYPAIDETPDGSLQVIGFPGGRDAVVRFDGDSGQVNGAVWWLRMRRSYQHSEVSGASGGGVYDREGDLVGIQSGVSNRWFLVTPIDQCMACVRKHIDEPADGDSLPPEAQPTPHPEVRQALSLLPLGPNVLFGDPGCGADARACIAAAREYGCRAIGIEIDAGRAESARQAVADAGVEHLVTIIHGDAREVEWEFDVAYVYLFGDMLAELRPKLVQLDAFASYAHEVPGLDMRQDGDLYLWGVPEQQQAAKPQRQQQPRDYAVWGGRVYHGDYNPGCNCAMCRSIRAQQGIPQPASGVASAPRRRGLFGGLFRR